MIVQNVLGSNNQIENSTEEVYYKFTFMENNNPEFKILKEDDYGWKLNTNLDQKTGELIENDVRYNGI